MSMRKATHLKLNGIDPPSYFAKELSLYNDTKELLKVDLKDPSNKIRAIVSLLAKVKLTLNLRPVRVAGKSDKEVWFALIADNTHGILVALSHISSASLKCRRKYHFPAYLKALLDALLRCFSNRSVVISP